MRNKERLLSVVVCIVIACATIPAIAISAPSDPNAGKGDALPISCKDGIDWQNITPGKLLELKTAGITINGSRSSGIADADLQLLRAMRQASINELIDLESIPTKQIGSYIAKIKDEPALYGYCLSGELTSGTFPTLAKRIKAIRGVDAAHPCYSDVPPMMSESADDYLDFLRKYIATCRPSLLMSTCYPVTTSGCEEDYFMNLEIISKVCQETGLNFWSSILTTPHSIYPKPTKGSLRFQLYSSLAYGAQGIEYNSYTTSGNNGYGNALIGRDGKATDTYNLVQEVNKEIQARAFVFLHSDTKYVRYIGNSIPAYGTELTLLPPGVVSIDTKGAGAIVAMKEKGGWCYLIVVNRRYNVNMPLKIKFFGKVERISTEGKIKSVKSYSGSIPPGEAEIFGWEKPF